MDTLPQIPIKNFMTPKPVTLHAEATLADAYQVMHEHLVRHVPVVDDHNKLVGIFSHTDLLRAYSPRETESGWYYDKEELALLSLRHFMTSEPAFLTDEQTLGEAAKMMARNKFGCVPIVSSESKKVAGIITYVDLLQQIAAIFP